MQECDNVILPSVTYAALHYIYGGSSSITYVLKKGRDKKLVIKFIIYHFYAFSNVLGKLNW